MKIERISEDIWLDDLVGRYDAFLVDQFGVLHDGRTPYSGAVAALKRLKAAGKKAIVISNSGKRSASNAERLASFGIMADDYVAMVTSGEVAWRLMKDGMAGTEIAAGARCLLIVRDDDRTAIDGLDFVHATDGNDADIIVLGGSRGDTLEFDYYLRLLEPAARRGVPCLCTNPDKVMLTAVGPRFGAGAIADAYVGMGGNVRWIGKPYPDIYRFALAAAGNPDPARVCCVGDSIEHDIAGGAHAGLATALVRTGILETADGATLQALYARHEARPDHVLARFSFREGGI